MITFLKKLFGMSDAPAPTPTPTTLTPTPAPAAPAPTEPAKCGCGRSPTGYCVGLHKLSDDEWASSDKNPNKVVPAPVTDQVSDAVTQTVAEAPAKTAKAPRAPKAPKAAKAETAPKEKKPRASRAKKA